MAPEPKLRKTYQEIVNFDGHARQWLAQHLEKTKFRYAIERMVKRSQSIFAEYNDQVEEITINNCATDDKGVILLDDRGQYKFTKEGLIKRNKERIALFRSETEIEPYFATEPPPSLPTEETDIFIDFVLKDRPPEPQEQAKADNDPPPPGQ